MSSNSYAIEANNLAKHYKIWKNPTARLRASIWSLVNRYDSNFQSKHFSTFKAVEQVSLKIKKGESVGIIGRNGSGKSTLLQIIAGTLRQTSGDINVSGKVAALLELGSGFNPEFSGRENININAAILGLTSKEIAERTPNIIEYSEIGDFIDQPVKTYSSGMQMRLAFSIAVHVDAEIFIIDEALSVGDAWFQLKCAKTMSNLVSSGKTLLLVSHSPIAIKSYCSRAILLDKGQILAEGDPNDVCNRYSLLVSGYDKVEKANVTPKLEKEHIQDNVNINREKRLEAILSNLFAKRRIGTESIIDLDEFEYGREHGSLHEISITGNGQTDKTILLPKEKLYVDFKATSQKQISGSVFGLTVKTSTGQEVYIYNTMFANCSTPDFTENQTRRFKIDIELNLMAGDYFISLGWVYFSGDEIKVVHRKYDFHKITILPEDHCAGIANLYANFQSVQ